VGRVSGFVAMSHVVSSSMGTASMAAQQVILSFFQCICPIADSLSLTAQSFVPGIVERRPGPERSRILRKTKVNFFKASIGFGLAMAFAVGNIPLVSGLFSSDPAVVGLINKCVPLLAAWFSMHGVMCASEGLLLGQKDLSFLGRMYAMWFAVVPYLMLRVKRAAMAQAPRAGAAVAASSGRFAGRAVDLTTIWQVFLLYQVLRSSLWAIRAATHEQEGSPPPSSSE
jgi:Na+-driven multidrug efflux pump